jgi:hypothetical protein
MGVLPVGMGVLPVGMGVLPVGMGVLPVGMGVLPVGMGVLPVGMGVLQLGVQTIHIQRYYPILTSHPKVLPHSNMEWGSTFGCELFAAWLHICEGVEV